MLIKQSALMMRWVLFSTNNVIQLSLLWLRDCFIAGWRYAYPAYGLPPGQFFTIYSRPLLICR
jgi:hypothetical protein